MKRALAKASLATLAALERAALAVGLGATPDLGVVLEHPQRVRGVLVWTMDRLGDVTRATPAIRSLRSRFPAARLDVVATRRAGPVLEGNPGVSSLHVLDDPWQPLAHYRALRDLRRNGPWDLAVLLEADPHWTRLGAWWLRYLRIGCGVAFDFGHGAPGGLVGVPLRERGSWIDQYLALAAAAGARPDERGMEIHVSAGARKRAEALLARHGIRAGQGFFLLHPGGNFLTVSRQWPPAAFAQLVDLLGERWSLPVVLTGVAAERETIDAIRSQARTPVVDLCAELGIRELAAVIERCSVMVANDTGPMHMAHALGTPTVVILGPTAVDVVGIPASAEVARAELPCSPCAFYMGWKTCTNPETWKCLSAVTPGQVFDAVAKQVNRLRLAS